MQEHCLDGSLTSKSLWFPAAFLCVADEAYGRIMPAAYLDKLAADWAAEIGGKLSDQKEAIREGQLTPTYSKRIKTLVDQITAHPEQFSKIQAVQQKV